MNVIFLRIISQTILGFENAGFLFQCQAFQE